MIQTNDFSVFIAGCFALKQQMLEDRRFPKVHLDSQRLLQVRNSLFLSIPYQVMKRREGVARMKRHVISVETDTRYAQDSRHMFHLLLVTFNAGDCVWGASNSKSKGEVLFKRLVCQ